MEHVFIIYMYINEIPSNGILQLHLWPFVTQFFKSNTNPIQPKGMPIMEPEPTQHSKPTFVWAYIPRHCVATLNPACLSRLLATKRLLCLSLLTVGDVNVTWCTCLMMFGMNFCWWIVTFSWNTQTEEDGGCISSGNNGLLQNILNYANYWQNFLISSQNITEWTEQLIQNIINNQQIHFNIYDVFYSQCSHQHVSAGILAIFRVTLLFTTQKYKFG